MVVTAIESQVTTNRSGNSALSKHFKLLASSSKPIPTVNSCLLYVYVARQCEWNRYYSVIMIRTDWNATNRGN